MQAWRTALLVLALPVMIVVAAGDTARAQAALAAPDRKARGNEKMVDSDFVGAIEDYEAALALTPNDPALYYNIGRAQGLLGHYPESLAALETFAARATPELRWKITSFDVLLADTRQHVGYLTITCPVPNARVQLDAQVVGAAPLARKAVKAGKATIKIEAEGYFDDERPATVVGTEELALECHLLPKSTSGTLAVSAEPVGARITVDGTFRGNNWVEVPLRAGPHSVAAQLDGYDATSTTLVIAAGSSQKVDLPLRPKAVPLTSRWWFWGGLAVVVAGGVAVSVAALTEKSADQGSIPPRQLGTPLQL